MTEKQIVQNAWPHIEKRDGLIEGSGIFTTKAIPTGQIVCNYGGELLSKVEGLKLEEIDLSDYLIELKIRDETFFYNNPTCIGYGGYLNHSKRHPNIYPKLYLTMNGRPEIMFIMKHKMPAGIQLVWDYGHAYKGVEQCVASCTKCGEFPIERWIEILFNLKCPFDLIEYHTYFTFD